MRREIAVQRGKRQPGHPVAARAHEVQQLAVLFGAELAVMRDVVLGVEVGLGAGEAAQMGGHEVRGAADGSDLLEEDLVGERLVHRAGSPSSTSSSYGCCRRRVPASRIIHAECGWPSGRNKRGSCSSAQ